jgi:hypothetical protein
MDLAANVQDLRCFVPSKDFATSKRFYAALGFREVWTDGKLALFELGRFKFFLQDYFVLQWAANAVLDLAVADADAFWVYLEALKLPEQFPSGVVRVGAPEPDPNVAIQRGHFVDPSGVLWHFSSPRAVES